MKTLLFTVTVSLLSHLMMWGIWTTPVYAAETKVSDIQGTVWVDFNNNQVIDQSEPLLANVTLCIKEISEMDFGDVGIINDESSDVGVVSLVTTDAKGQYEITGLKDGFYKIWAEERGDEESGILVIVNKVEDDSAFSPFINIPAQAYKLFMPVASR